MWFRRTNPLPPPQKSCEARSIADIQTWHAPTQSYISTPRQFGYDLRVEDMPAALARFFPLPDETITEYIDPSAASAKAASQDTRPEKETRESEAGLQSAQGSDTAAAAGSASATATGSSSASASATEPASASTDAASTSAVQSTATEAEKTSKSENATTEQSSPQSYTNHAIPLPLLSRLLQTLLLRLNLLRKALSTAEIRAVGASLLVVYESDPVRLAADFTALDEGKVKWKEDEEIDETSSEECEEGEAKGGKGEEPRLPITVHLIDFAHTVATPGRGADEGVLMGLDKFVQLVEGRLEVVRRALGEGAGAGEAPAVGEGKGTGEGEAGAERGGMGGAQEGEEGGVQGGQGERADEGERETKKAKVE